MKLGAVILAAGAGSRLGGVAKALLPSQGTSFLGRIATTARVVGLEQAIVVVGPPHGEHVVEEAHRHGLEVVVNAEPARGMASSIALGFARLRLDLDAAWLWPVDHPGVRADTLRALIAGLGSHQVARPVVVHNGVPRGGHPPLIVRSIWPTLAGCDTISGGARSVIATSDAVSIEVDDQAVVRDIDTAEDRANNE